MKQHRSQGYLSVQHALPVLALGEPSVNGSSEAEAPGGRSELGQDFGCRTVADE